MDVMDCTGNIQKSLNTMESDIIVSLTKELDLANQLEGESHGLGVANLVSQNHFLQ